MSETRTPSKIELGGITHSAAGIISLVIGGLMYWYGWAITAFSVLMVISAVSAMLISWRMDAWVPGHWLSMAPILGIAAGYAGVPGGFTFAYVCLWLAFLHFVRRGIQGMGASA